MYLDYSVTYQIPGDLVAGSVYMNNDASNDPSLTHYI